MDDPTTDPEQPEQPAADVKPKRSAIDWANTRLTAGLVRAIAAAQARVVEAGAVAKAGMNNDRGYSYATADDMVAFAHRAISGVDGLAWVTASIVQGVSPDEIPTGSDNQWVCSVVRTTSVVMHAADGGDVGVLVMNGESCAIASRGRPPDKAEAAAETYLLGFLARDLLGLWRDDVPTDETKPREPDVDGRPESDATVRRPAERKGRRDSESAKREREPAAKPQIDPEVRREAEQATRALVAARRLRGDSAPGGHGVLTPAHVIADLMGAGWELRRTVDAQALAVTARRALEDLQREMEKLERGS